MSGGVGGAQAGTLTFMVGADEALFETLQAGAAGMGKNIVHCGETGTGQIAKICNNLLLAHLDDRRRRGDDARRSARHRSEGAGEHRQHVDRALLEFGYV